MSGSLKRRSSEEMTQLNTSSPWGLEVPFESYRGWWQLKSPKTKRFLEERRIEGKKESVLLFVREEQIEESINIKG